MQPPAIVPVITLVPNSTLSVDPARLCTAKACPFVAEALRNLRREVGTSATVLGFIGLPYTLATYMVEGTYRYL